MKLENWVAKTLKGCKAVAPYILKAENEYALDALGDLAAWCHANGSPASLIINAPNGRYIRIADPLCRELELAGLIES